MEKFLSYASFWKLSRIRMILGVKIKSKFLPFIVFVFFFLSFSSFGAFRISSLFHVFLSLFTTESTIPQGIPGINVDSNGLANSSIPIALPPGTADLVPGISLAYVSQSGFGLLGDNWDLQGFPVISRDSSYGLRFDNSDHYASSLGGKLIDISGQGTEYTTKPESFYKYTKSADCSSNACSWIVKDSSGITYTFGATSDSVLLAGSVPVVWGLSNVTDLYGNSYQITYTQQTGNLYPNTVQYGNRSVKFIYASPSKIIGGYSLGFYRADSKILEEIQISVGGSVVRTYEFTYAQGANGLDILQKLDRSESNQWGSASFDSLNFEYTSYNAGNPVLNANYGISGTDLKALVRVPLIDKGSCINGATECIIAGNACAPGPPTAVALCENAKATALLACTIYQATFLDPCGNGQKTIETIGHWIDINGDGWLDYLRLTGNEDSGLILKTLINQKGNGFAEASGTRTVSSYQDNSAHTISIGDITGDNRTDFLISNGQYLSFFQGSTNGFGPLQIISSVPNPSSAPNYLTDAPSSTQASSASDINRDGIGDYIEIVDDSTIRVALSASGSPFQNVYTIAAPNVTSLPGSFLDLTGDGVPEFVRFKNTNLIQVYRFNADLTGLEQLADSNVGFNGNDATTGVDDYGFNQQTSYPSRWWGDLNGDGLLDFSTYSSGVVSVFLNQYGTFPSSPNFTANIGIDLSYIAGVNKSVLFGDVNGDGFDDLVIGDGSNAKVYYSTGTSLSNAPGSVIATNGELQLADINSDTREDIISINVASGSTNGDWNVYSVSNALPGNLLTKISSSYGVYSSISYARKSELSGASNPASNSYPIIADPSNLPVVTSVFDNLGGSGTTLTQTTTYTYQNGKILLGDPSTTSMLGFGTISSTNSRTGITDVVTYNQTSGLYVGFPSSKKKYVNTGTTNNLVSQESFTYESATFRGNAYGRILSSFKSSSLGGVTIHSSITSYGYDSCGNVKGKIETEQGGSVITDTATYDCDQANWILDRLTFASKTRDQTLLSETNFTYSGNDLVTQTTFPSSSTPKVRSFTYDTYGNPVTVTDSNGNTANLTYDSEIHRFLVQTTNSLGQTKSSVYDTVLGGIITVTDSNGGVTTSQYDPFGRLLQVNNPGESDWSESFSYYHTGDPATQYSQKNVRDDLYGSLYTRQYANGLGKVYRTETSTVAGRLLVELTNYLPNGNVTSKSTSFVEGITTPGYTSYTYHGPDGSVDTITSPEGNITTIQTNGLVTSTTMTDPGGNSLTTGSVTKDAFGNTLSKTVNGKAIQYTYDGAGRPTQITDPASGQTTIKYDSFGRKTQVTDSNSGTIRYTYDAEGNLLTQKDARGITITASFDSLNRIVSTIPSNGDPGVYYSYDANENGIERLSSVTDGAGTTSFQYDIRGNIIRKVKAIDDLIFVFGFNFDSRNRVQDITYPDGSIVHNQYSEVGVLTGVTMDVPSQSSYGHAVVTYQGPFPGSNGSFYSTRITGNQVETDVYFDPILQRATKYITNLSNGSTSQNISFNYDSLGNITKIIDGVYSDRTQTFAYDSLNRLTQAVGKYGTESYSYTDRGNLTKRGDYTLTYGDSSRPQAVTSAYNVNAGTLNYSYDASGNMINRNGDTLNYDAFGKLTSILPNGGGQVSFSNDYTGKRVKKMNGTSIVFEPDSLYEVTRQAGQSDIHTLYVRGIEGDLVAQFARNDANLITVSDAVLPTMASIPFWKDKKDRMIYSAKSSLKSFLFERNGKLSARYILFVWSILFLSICYFAYSPRTWGMIRDSFKRIAVLPAPLAIIGMFFLSVTNCGLFIPNQNQSGTPPWLLAGIGSGVDSGSPGVSSPGDGSGSGSGSVGGTPVAGMIFFHPDQLGSITMATNGNGTVLTGGDGGGVSSIIYSPYGKIDRTNSTGPDVFRYKFNGQTEDRDTGLQYFKSRYYDSNLGRFLQADSIVDHGNIQGMNRYMFVNGSPIGKGDYTGNNAWIHMFNRIVGHMMGKHFGHQGLDKVGDQISNAYKRTWSMSGIRAATYIRTAGESHGWRLIMQNLDHQWRGYLHSIDHQWRGYAHSVDHQWRGYAHSIDHQWRGYAHSVDHQWRGYAHSIDHQWRNYAHSADHEWKNIARGIDGEVREILSGGTFSRNHGTRMWNIQRSDLGKLITRNREYLYIGWEMFGAVTSTYALFTGISAAIELESAAVILGGEVSASTILATIGNWTVGFTYLIFGEVIAVIAAIGVALLAVIELMELTGSSAMPNGGMFGGTGGGMGPAA